MPGSLEYQSFGETDAAALDRLLAVNVRAPYQVTSGLVDSLADDARVLFTSSIVAKTFFPGSDRLRDHQGRDRHADPLPCRRARRARHPGQRNRSRRDRHGHGCGLPRDRRRQGAGLVDPGAEADRPARRYRACRRLPGRA